MSTATMSGADPVKPSVASAVSGSKQPLRTSSTSGSGKALDAARKQTASPIEGQKSKQTPQSQPPQPKAWQGPNPLTQRSSTHTPNGTEKALPKIPPPSQMKSTTPSNADKHAHDRALWAFANFTGHEVTLTLKNGEQYTGVFSGASFEPNSKHHYTLKMVRRITSPTHSQLNGDTGISEEYIGEGEDHGMLFDKDDVVDLAVNNVIPANALPMQNGSLTSFRTDTEISRTDAPLPRQRELQRWEPGADSNIDMSLGDSADTSWDQFAANERMYGVQSDYDENMYTTVIDRSNPQFKQREMDAARIAREIEGSAPATGHVAEERRRDADRADAVDEEEKYSGVQREAVVLPKRGVGAYVPPSQRPITTAPTVPGAPFDPAIISSQLAKPAPLPATEKSAESTAVVDAPIATTEDPNAAALKSAPQAAPTATKEITAEDHVRNATEAFRQFANDQKLRHRQAAEAKRSNARAEKNVKLNDLKKFAENFKLKSRVPDDLVPILAKDPHKQHEIQHKAEEAAKLEEVRAKEREKEKATSTASPTPSSSSQVAPTPPTDQRMSFTQSQNSRARLSQNLRSLPPTQQSPGKTAGQAVAAGSRGFSRGMPGVQALPPGMQIPTGPAVSPEAAGPMSPSRLNAGAKAFEFRPAASSFTPSAASPSPQRTDASSRDRANVTETANFFDKEKKPRDAQDRKDLENEFHPIKRMFEANYPDPGWKKDITENGVPYPYRTQPTWPFTPQNVNVSYKDAFVKSQVPSSGPSPMHTPNPNSQMPHAHQLPHLQGTPQMPTPSQRGPYMSTPQQHGVPPQGFDPRMQFGPNGSVQSSPRFPQAQVAFNGQMQGLPMPPFPAQQMQGYQMSPSMQYRQVAMPPNGPMMMMPAQQHGQMAPMNQGYPPRGPQNQGYQTMIGGVAMVNQASSGFMNGPMPQGAPSYSPMPPPAQPHMSHMQNQGYAGSPRPHMMQHSGSHQGFNPAAMMGGGGGGGGGPPQFAPSPAAGPPHPYAMQQRQMSAGAAGYPHMTPRQHHSIPTHPSPGMGMGVPAQGDEGK